MRSVNRLLNVTAVLLVAFASTADARSHRDLGRQVLDQNDGWAAFGSGTTGGSLATSDHVYVVTDRQELIAALNDGVYPAPSSTPSSVPKIIYVKGTIDANVDDNNQPLACEDYYRDGYTLESFLETYDPEIWGRQEPAGPLEDARIASRNAQQARVRIRVGSNTTIVGLGKHARIKGAWLDIRGQAGVPDSRSNIIIRNITFQDTYDCFPEWSPDDGENGAWNAQYDSISLRDANNVWIDHNTFEDRATRDDRQPRYFGVLYQVHDGLVDITNASDLVTVSWNVFRNHDKTMLIGSSDSATADRGKLRVTLHHNLFDNIGQRAPRVRYGQVHIYNNFYRVQHLPTYAYSWGVGIESAIYAENNFFKTDRKITPDQFIARFNGTAIHESGTYVNGLGPRHAVDVVAAYNAVNDPDLARDVGWAPSLYDFVAPTWTVVPTVLSKAGPFAW
jgi:pectate lyase